MRIVLRISALAFVLASGSLPAAAQEQRPLSLAAFDRWQSVSGTALSDDGRWLVYSTVPQVGEGEVIVRGLPNGPEFRHSRGFIGRPVTRPSAQGADRYTPSPAQITGDGGWVLFTIEPSRDSVERAQRSRRRGAAPRPALGIMRTSDGAVTIIPGVRSYRVPQRNSRLAVYHLSPRDSVEQRPAVDSAVAAVAVPGQQPVAVAGSDTVRAPARREYGTALIVRDLASGEEVRIEEVSAYLLDDRGERLAYTVNSRDSTRNGVYVRTLSSARTETVLSGAGIYRALTMDREGTQLVFLAERRADSLHASQRIPKFSLYHSRLAAPAARELIARARLGDSLMLSDRGRLELSRDGRVVLLTVAPPPPDSIPADSLYDKAVLDIWHWRDPKLQPQQQIEAGREQGRRWSAAFDLASGRFQVLGNDTLQSITFSDDGRVALAVTSVPYSVEAMWGEGGMDVVLLDAQTGARRLVAERVPFGAELSPNGRYVLWFGADHRWYAHGTASNRTVDLTGRLGGVRFDRETWDTPSTPASWGVGGWTREDRSVLLYDRYDVWEVDPSGQRAPRMVTDSVGRRENIVFRVVRLDPEERTLDPTAPLMLRAVHDSARTSGFWRDRLDAATPPARLVMEDRALGSLMRAREADVYIYTRQSFREFPDLWVADGDFRQRSRVSDVNPQQADFRWGTAELVHWRSADGVPLAGVLYKPDGFDPGRQYPMVVYFYEQLSQNLHNYVMTMPRNTIQPTHYVSHGYLVFFPDIAYSDGYPGPSAAKSVIPGVQMLIDRGFVDPDAIGIAGQSWGGYQTAYIITQSNMFRAAFAGAPVANMTSAYGGIRWASGLARPFQYERTQSRIGGSLWEYPLRYLENSPLFMADRIRTPLLIMHNDNDGAVPWYQGIEMFIALRRLQREVYLINYNGDEHNPTKRANQADMAMRMMQFFDHHLRGGPLPEWMERGIPYLERGRDSRRIASPAITEQEQPRPTGGN